MINNSPIEFHNPLLTLIGLSGVRTLVQPSYDFQGLTTSNYNIAPSG
jgi:hypothetical protein